MPPKTKRSKKSRNPKIQKVMNKTYASALMRGIQPLFNGLSRQIDKLKHLLSKPNKSTKSSKSNKSQNNSKK